MTPYNVIEPYLPPVAANNTAQFSSADKFTNKKLISDEQAGKLIKSSSLTNSDRQLLAAYLANRFGVSKTLAFRLTRKLKATSNAGTLDDIKKVFEQVLKGEKVTTQSKAAGDVFTTKVNKNPAEQNLASIFQQRQAKVQEAALNQASFQKSFAAQSRSAFPQDLPIEKFIPLLNQSVSNPQQFASLLVNSRHAFVLLKTNPQLLSFLIGINNPNFQPSPALMAKLFALVSQVLRAKLGKHGVDELDEDDQLKFNRKQDEMVEEHDHQNSLVNSIKHTIETIPVKSLRDFLLEAERFAEEEIVNMWSLALKKEKEIENQIIEQLKKLGH